ncbi:MFS transporter [Burkholderia sp. 22PA0106]|uniref:MFS transporter n=1 Tax=Burkholderia sp. 22PA0106 TaxID=3237371 RepID=UPI0039C40DAD
MFDDLIEARPVGGRQLLVYALCLSVLIIDGMDVQLLAFASPVLMRAWAVTKTQLAPAMSAALVGMALGAACGGIAADRLGARRTLLGAVVTFGAATLGSALAGNVAQLIAMRLLSGVGFGIAVPTAMTLVADWSPRRRRGQLVLLMSIGTTLGGTLGGVLAAWLIPVSGWRGLFVASGGITLAAAVLGAMLLPESLTFLVRRACLDEARAWLARMGFDALDALPAPARETASTAMDERLLAPANRRVNAGLWTAFFTLSYTAYAYLSWTPAILTGAGFGLRDAIADTSTYTFAAVLGVLVSGLLLPRAGSRGLSTLAILITVAATVALPRLLGDGAAMPGGVAAAMGLAGFGGGMAQSTLYALAATAYPAACRATALGICVGVSRVGGIVGTALGGVLLQAGGPGGSYFRVLAGMLAVGLVALLAMNRHTPATGLLARRASA